MSIESISTQLPVTALSPTRQGGAEAAEARAPVATAGSIAPTSRAEGLKTVEAMKPSAGSDQELKDAVKAIEDFIKPITSNLDFSIDEDTSMRVVKVIDNSTKEVIRQFPSEEVLQIAKALDRLQGLLIEQKA